MKLYFVLRFLKMGETKTDNEDTSKQKDKTNKQTINNNKSDKRLTRQSTKQPCKQISRQN